MPLTSPREELSQQSTSKTLLQVIALAPRGSQVFNRQDLLAFTWFEMTLRFTYMKKTNHILVITDPQQSLIISIRELYLKSEENHEESLGTPTKCAAWWAAEAELCLVTELTAPASPYPLTNEVLLTEPQLCLKAGIILVFYPKCCLEVREPDRVTLQGSSFTWDLCVWQFGCSVVCTTLLLLQDQF